jgi:hypothetical protein
MPLTISDRILGPARGSAEGALAIARAGGATRLDELDGYLREVYRLAAAVGIDPAIVVAQSALETSNWTDHWWTQRLNPAGIGITGDPAQNEASMTWPSGADSARGQIVHLWLYARGQPLPEPLAPFAGLDPRRDALPPASLGACPTLGSLGGRWAVVADYGDRIANRARQIFPDLPDQGQEPITPREATMGWQKARFKGLDADVWLPDDIEVVIDIVPDDKIGWVRSGNHTTGQNKTTFHDTGTPGSTARTQRNYLHGGPTERKKDGTIGRRLVGFNFAVDDTRVIQLTPLDEETWAAGTDAGNRASWAIEQCFGGDINWDRSLRNAIALHGGLIAAKGWSTDTALVPHKFWRGKWCPGQILNRNLWPTVLHRVGEAAAAARAAAGGAVGGAAGTTTTTTGPFAAPSPIPELVPFRSGDVDRVPAVVRVSDGSPFFFVGDRVRAIRATPRLQLADPASDRIGPDLKEGDEFDVSWVFVSENDNEAYYVTPFDTRILVKDTERIGDRPDQPVVPTPAISPDGQDGERSEVERGGVLAGTLLVAEVDDAPGH